MRRVCGAASCVLAVLALLGAGCKREGPYPSREIRLIVHASPGGISDAVSRHAARALQAELGVPVVCENRAGAAGSVALTYVAKSRADGYTIGYAPVDLAIVPHLGYARVSPDDFDFLVRHTRAPASLAVRSDSPWRSLDELVRDAREKPGAVNVATSGMGSIWHLASLALARAARVQLNYVPYAGSGQAVTALLGSHVHAVVAGPAEVQAHVEAGTLRVLGVMSDDRSPIFAQVPTFQEQGYELQIDAWGGFLAPKGVPTERTQKLIAAMTRVIASDDFQRFCRERGLEIDLLAGEEFRDFAGSEFRAFGDLMKQTGLARP